MLVELRRQLDEIARHRGAGEQRIGHVRQQAVQRVAEFVEQRARVVERQQRRLARRRLGEIADVEDDRADVAGKLFLVAQRGHPGAAVLGAAREIIADEQADMAAGRVLHLEGAGVGVIERHADGREAQAEQPARGLEGGLDHLVELEVRLDLGFVQIVARLAQLLGVVAPVPRRQREIAALLRDHRLQRVALGRGLGARAAPDLVEQLARRLRGLGHLIVEPVVGESRKAEQLRPLGAQAPPSRRSARGCRSRRRSRRA